jgi:signal transduction histidine kinase
MLNELRGPLSSILGLSLTMKSVVESDEAKVMVRQLAANAKRLERLLVDVGDAGRIATGNLELRRRKTDLEAMVTRIIGETPELEHRIVQVATSAAKASVDAARAAQIVEGLLFNALERTRASSPVWISVQPHEDGALIAVDDESTEDPAKAVSRLTLVDKLAELHGGRLWAEPRAAGGVSFRVWLPESPRSGGGGAEAVAAVGDVRGSDAE